MKVVVVTSTDRVFENVITLRDQGGPAHKRNLAVQYFGKESKYLIFLDDDVELASSTLWTLVEEMENKPQCGMGFCKILNMERRDVFDDCGSWITSTGFLWARAQNNQTDTGQFDQSCKVLASKSATCIVRRDVFVQVGGFDVSYYILGEETDVGWRCWLAGYECWYFSSAVSWHAFGTSLKPKSKYYTLDRIHFHGAKNYLNLLLTNLGVSRLCRILPIHLSAWCAAAVGFAVRGQWKRSLLILKGIGWNFMPSNWKRTMEKRRKVQRTRTVTDRELWPLIGYSPPPSYYLSRLARYIMQGLHG